MKTKIGFVSNSSTSSFVIAVHEDKASEEEINVLEMFQQMRDVGVLDDNRSYEHYREGGEVDEVIESLEDEIEQIDNNVQFAQSRLEEVEGFFRDNIARVEGAVMMRRIINEDRFGVSEKDPCGSVDLQHRIKETQEAVMSDVSRSLGVYRKAVEEFGEKKARLQGLIDKLKPIEGQGYTIMTFSVSHQVHGLRRLVDKMVECGKAIELVEREMT